MASQESDHVMTREERVAKYGNGPWVDEPDRVEFEHEGFPCLVTRQAERGGHLCGYVAVPPGHPWHGKDYGDIDADAHGGVNYAAPCFGKVCHVPKPGEPDDVWWFGFDCAHGGDIRPGDDVEMARAGFDPYRSVFHRVSVYRDVEYVKRECQRLAEQAKAAGNA